MLRILRGFRTYVPIDDQGKGGADFSMVEIGDMGKPSCKTHKAMNKVSSTENGGFWRCLQGTCRAGCMEAKDV